MKKIATIIVFTCAVAGIANVSHATLANGTYEFEPIVGNLYGDSTVTISGGFITDYLMVVNDAPFPNLTPGNSVLISPLPSSFEIGGGYAFYLGDVASAAYGGYLGDVQNAGPSAGDWTLEAAAAAPDTASTVELLGAAMVSLGVGRRFLRR